MSFNNSEVRNLVFHGDGGKLFGIYIVNLLLSIVTLGLYYPWARAAVLKYVYQETELEGSRFTFHGTGKEMFIGFIKAVLIIAALYAIPILAALTANPFIMIMGFLAFLVGSLLLIPIAIHGSLRYRLSRTSWRGIHWGYRGSRGKLISKMIVGGLLTIITFGIYGFWFAVDMRKYIMENVRFGSIQFGFKGRGEDLFVVYLKGYLLTIVTLGIYSFWFAKDIYQFHVDNTRIYQDDRTLRMYSTATGGGFFSLIIVNALILIFTLGLGFAWVVFRSLRFHMEHASIEGHFDPDAIEQTEEDYRDATSDDMANILDVDIV